MDQSPALSPATLAWTADGTPWSVDYGDIYHSADGGLGQARHVFLGGNGLLKEGGTAARWGGRECFVIVETGFGTGLNFLATWQAWRDDPQRCDRLHFVSFEKHPFTSSDLAQLHARWPELAECSASLRTQWPSLLPGAHRLDFEEGRVVLTLFFGDATELLPKLRARVDAFYLDGFAPGKNPELWSPRICSSLARLARNDATLATWSVAGAVRRDLSAAGFLLDKVPGFGGKREMTRGHFRVVRHEPPCSIGARHALIIGAGLAGCSMAWQLARRGWRVDLIDAADRPAQGTSGNLAGIFRPLPSHDDNLLARWTRAGFLHLQRHLAGLSAAEVTSCHDACGVLHLARDPQHEALQRQLVYQQQPPAEYLRFVEREEAQALAGWPVALGGWWFPGGGWVQPDRFCQAQLNRCGAALTTHWKRKARRCVRTETGWHVWDDQEQCIASAPVLILANANGAASLLAGIEPATASPLRLPLRPARGQVSHLAAHALPAPEVVVCRLGYVTPVIDGTRSIGASFVADDEDCTLRTADHHDNLARLDFTLPGANDHLGHLGHLDLTNVDNLPGRASVRSMTQDRLPLVGALPCPPRQAEAADEPTALEDIPRQPELYGLLGLGARGLVWSALAAELLACQIEGEPLPLEGDLVAAVDPARFLLRRARRAQRTQHTAGAAAEDFLTFPEGGTAAD